MNHKPPAPQLPKLTASQRAKVLISLGVLKAPGVKPYRTYPAPKPKPYKPVQIDHRLISVRCVQTGEVFPSLAAAARAHYLQASNLCAHLKGKAHTVNGRSYEIVDTQAAQSHHSTTPRPIRCIDDGQEFRSLTACAKHYGITVSNLHNHLNGKQERVKKYRFEYV